MFLANHPATNHTPTDGTHSPKAKVLEELSNGNIVNMKSPDSIV